MLHLNANRGRFGGGTAGQIYGHSAAASCVAVAAVDVSSAAGPGGVFNGTESVETFSTDGPRRVHYDAAGTPITPGNFSTTGGTLRQKPDITAADGVATATPGFDPFYGTSAAAPHAAAIAALLIDRGIATTPAAIRQKMEDTALDIEAAGVDRDSGAGITDAYDALYGPPSTVDAHSSPQADRDLPDWNDTEPEKMSVLKFRVTDQGEDGMATLIDQVTVDISGTAGQAANDIAWAELHDGTVQVATAASITDAQIVFGAAPNSDSVAQLDAVPDDAYVEYTVNIYLDTTLLGQHDETYVFDVDETNIGVDGGSSSLMAADSGAVTPVTGTLFVTALGITVTPDQWTIGPQPLNYIEESGTFTAENTGNVVEDISLVVRICG